MPFCFRPKYFPQGEEYDCWDAIAVYVFQVIPFSVSLPGHLTLPTEQPRCQICIDAPSRSDGDSCGRSSAGEKIFKVLSLDRRGIRMTSHPYWLQSGRILWWMKEEVSPYHKRILGVSFFPVGRIICEENKPLTIPVSTPLHPFTQTSPQFHKQQNASRSLSRTSTTSLQYAESSKKPQEVAVQTSKEPQPNFLASRQLYSLARSSPEFHDQLRNILDSEEYKQSVTNLQGEDLVQLVDYLDEVHHCVTLPCSPVKPA